MNIFLKKNSAADRLFGYIYNIARLKVEVFAFSFKKDC